MKEIAPITETGHTAEIGHIVEIGQEAITTKMTIEMSIEMVVEMKIIETRDIRKNIKTIILTHMRRATIELVTKTGVGAKINIKVKTGKVMTAMIWEEIGLERNLAHMMKGKSLTDQS